MISWREHVSRPGPAHLIRAIKAYGDLGGGRLAASIALPAFLAFFPLMALGFAVLGFVVDGHTGVQQDLLDSVSDYLPGLLCSGEVANHPCTGQQIDIATIASSKATAGVIGLLGLLFAGLGWMGALRNALQIVFLGRPVKANLAQGFLRNLAQLIVLGLGLLISVGIGGVAGATAGTASGWIGLDGPWAAAAVRLVGIAVSVGVNVVLFVALYRELGHSPGSVRRGALLAALGLGALQQVGALYIVRTTNNPVYGSFAVVVGLLVWLQLVSQWTLFSATWIKESQGTS